MGEVLCSTENSPFLIIDHIHAKINRVCCAALAIGKRCMNVRKNKLFDYGATCQKFKEVWLDLRAYVVFVTKFKKIEYFIFLTSKHE